MAYSKKEIQKAKDFIIEEMSEGASLKSILDNNPLPSRQIIYNWLNSNHKDFDLDFIDNYVRAREDSADLDAEQIKEIVDGVLDGTYKSDVGRVAMDGLKWSAGVKKPKKYGSKIDVTSGDKPLEFVKYTEEERLKRIEELSKK